MGSKNAEDVLMEKKAKTEDGIISGEVQEVGVTYRLDCSVTEKLRGVEDSAILDLEFYKDLISDSAFSYVNYPNLNAFSEGYIADSEEIQDEFFNSIEYMNSSMEIPIERFNLRYIQRLPIFGVHIEDQFGSEYTICFDLFDLKKFSSITCLTINSEVDIDLQENLLLYSNERVDCNIYYEETMYTLFNTELFSRLQDGYKKSGFTYWSSVELVGNNNLELESDTDDMKIQIPYIHSEWKFDNPDFWDQNSDIVQLISNFANGDPSQLDNVLVRPTHGDIDDNVNTVESTDGVWEIALEKPSTEEDNSLFNIF